MQLRQLNATEAEAQLYGRLASSVIYNHSWYYAPMPVLSSITERGQSGLWAYAISGDLPIVLLQINKLTNIELVSQLVQSPCLLALKRP